MRLCLCLLSALSWSIQAHATVINFDDLTGQSCNNANITTCGPNVIDQYAALGVTFNNPTPAGQDVADTLLTPLIPDASAPNVLFVYQGGTQQTTPFASVSNTVLHSGHVGGIRLRQQHGFVPRVGCIRQLKHAA